MLAFVSAITDSDEQSVLTPVQLMWINLFQDTLAALALATDRPQRTVLNRAPEAKTAPLINIPMLKTIIAQSIYQLAVTYVLYFAGPRIFQFDVGVELEQKESLVFNTYVWMQIFNMYKYVSPPSPAGNPDALLTETHSCRQYDNTLNVFEGMFSNWLFLSVSASMIGLQILIAFVGGQAFSVVPLTGPQWAASLVLGLLALAVGALTRCVPDWPLERLVGCIGWKPPTRPAPPVGGG